MYQLGHKSKYGLEQIKAPWLEGVECSPAVVMSDLEPHFRNTCHLSSSSTEFKSAVTKSACGGFVCFTRLVTKMTNSPAALVQRLHRGQVSQKGARCLSIILLDLTTGLELDWPCDVQIRAAIVKTHLSTIANQG